MANHRFDKHEAEFGAKRRGFVRIVRLWRLKLIVIVASRMRKASRLTCSANSDLRKPKLMAPEPDDREIRGACPLDCPDTCSWIVTVKSGEAVALRGDPAHPYTRGSLCN